MAVLPEQSYISLREYSTQMLKLSYTPEVPIRVTNSIGSALERFTRMKRKAAEEVDLESSQGMQLY